MMKLGRAHMGYEESGDTRSLAYNGGDCRASGVWRAPLRAESALYPRAQRGAHLEERGYCGMDTAAETGADQQHRQQRGQARMGQMGTIAGVVVQQLTRHADERGYFEELIRVTDPWFAEGFAQLSHSKMYPGVVKAWHIHPTQIDWWYVAAGRLMIALHDRRPDSPTYR